MRYSITLTAASMLATMANAEVPKVVTDFTPVHALVSLVMGDLGTPLILLPKSADPHDFQMRPSQAKALDAADLVIWIGPQFTPWLARALEGLESTAAQLKLLEATETQTRPFAEDHDHQGSHDEHKTNGNIDPHAWLNPENAAAWLPLIAAELAQTDPENSAEYAKNAAMAQTRIATLDREVMAILDPVKERPFGVYHDAYGYFADHYGLNIAGALSHGDASAPGTARLAGLRRDLQDASATCLFPELNHDPALARQMIEGTTIRLGDPLDPEGSNLEPGPAAYDALLRGLAQTIAACLTR